MYFLRLAKIKPAVEQVAASSWQGTVIGGEEVKRVERVLDVRQGDLCWVAGTVYMDMPLKPNILDDVSKDVGLLHLIIFLLLLRPLSHSLLDVICADLSTPRNGSRPRYLLSKPTSLPTVPTKFCWRMTRVAFVWSATCCKPFPS